MSVIDPHNATGQMYGYLFQLSQTKPEGMVGIETGDDVVVRTSDRPDSEQIFEQDKHSTSNSKPFGNLSKDLWNTLLIWTTGVSSGKVDIEKSSFLMVSNKELPSGRFVWKINQALSEESSLECAKQLRKLGEKHKGKLQPIITKVLAHRDEELASIILTIISIGKPCSFIERAISIDLF